MSCHTLTIESSIPSVCAVEHEIIQRLRSQMENAAGQALLYEDPDFPAELSSLYVDPSIQLDNVSEEISSHVYWYRPTEYTEDPDYFKSAADCGVLREGLVNDAWLLGVFAAIAFHPNNLIPKLLVSESVHTFKQFGVYTCRFYKDDAWISVTTDTRIPYSRELSPDESSSINFTSSLPGSPLYGSSVNKNQVLIPLLEKAYAKLHGSYQVLDETYGERGNGSSDRILEAFLDCTGGSAHRIDLQQERLKQIKWEQFQAENATPRASSPSLLLWKRLLCYRKKQCILTTQVRSFGSTGPEVTGTGILTNRQYILQHVTEIGLSFPPKSSSIDDETNTLRFLKLKTVWERGMWKGKWSNDDSKWQEHVDIEEAMRSDPECEFSRAGHDGCFWMVWEDFFDTFTELFVVHLFPSDSYQYCVRGEWVGPSAAGPPRKTSIEDKGQHLKEQGIEKTQWKWLHDAEPNWHCNQQFKLSIPVDTTLADEMQRIQPVKDVLVSLTQRDSRLYGGANVAINVVLLREKMPSAADSPRALWEFKRSHVVFEAHSSFASMDGSKRNTVAPPTSSYSSTLRTAPSSSSSSSSGHTISSQTKTRPERELVLEDVQLTPGVTYYLVPYTTHPKVEMEYFLRIVSPLPVCLERVPPLLSVVRTSQWRMNQDETTSSRGALDDTKKDTININSAGGPLMTLPWPTTHVAGRINAAWCQNPQFWIRFAERSPREQSRLRDLVATKPFVTMKLVLRQTLHRVQPRDEKETRANLLGLTAIRASPVSLTPVIVTGSGSSAATQLRARSKSQKKMNFLGHVVPSPFANASTAMRKNGIRNRKNVSNIEKMTKICIDDLYEEYEAPEEDGEPGTGTFPSPKVVVNATDWCRLSSYASSTSACLYLGKVPKEWLFACDSLTAGNGRKRGGLLVIPTRGEADAEGVFELQVDCEFPLLVTELPQGAGAIQSIPGEWTALKSGGCHLHSEWRQNPTFSLHFQGTRPSKVHITLTRSAQEWERQCHRDSIGSMIGFYLFRRNATNDRPWCETDFVPLHSVSLPPFSTALKDPGYVIMPATYEPRRIGKFILSVQCDTKFRLTCDSE